jgi:hypothetical protein
LDEYLNHSCDANTWLIDEDAHGQTQHRTGGRGHPRSRDLEQRRRLCRGPRAVFVRCHDVPSDTDRRGLAAHRRAEGLRRTLSSDDSSAHQRAPISSALDVTDVRDQRSWTPGSVVRSS